MVSLVYLELRAKSFGVEKLSVMGVFSGFRNFIFFKLVVFVEECVYQQYVVIVSLTDSGHDSSPSEFPFSCVQHSLEREKLLGESIQKMRVV